MNYMVPIIPNLPAVQTNTQCTLSTQIAVQTYQYQFPICNSTNFNLDNAYGLIQNNLGNEYTKDIHLNLLAQQTVPIVNPNIAAFMNYNGSVVLNTGDKIVADEASLCQVCNSKPAREISLQNNSLSTDNLEKLTKLRIINMIMYLISTIGTLLPEFIERFIKPRITGNRALKCLPPLVQTLKGELLRQILFHRSEIFYADNQGALQAYIKKRVKEMELSVPWSQYTIKTNRPLWKIKKVLQQPIQCVYLFKTLYQITDGSISKFEKLCRLSAKILIGRKILSNELKIKPVLTVIKTSNFKFILQFFSSIGDINSPTVRNKRGHQSVYTNIIQRVNDKLAFDAGHYKMVSNLSPVRDTAILSNKPNAELNNPENVGKLIEADIEGNLLNVTAEKVPDTQLSTLRNLVVGNSVEKSNRYLGVQSFTSNAQFVQLEYPDAGYEQILQKNKIPYEVIELGLNINPYSGLFENGEGFNPVEIAWFWSVTAIRGLDFLYDETPTNSQDNVDPFVQFMKTSVELAAYSEDKTDPGHKNVIPFKTLEAMYTKFLKITHPNQPTKKINIDQTFLKLHGYGMYECMKCKNALAHNVLVENGYSEDEIASKDSNYMHILGLKIKPKKILLQEFEKIAQKHTANLKLSMEEFIAYILKEAKIVLNISELIDLMNAQ